jgi:hypothetical protein
MLKEQLGRHDGSRCLFPLVMLPADLTNRATFETADTSRHPAIRDLPPTSSLTPRTHSLNSYTGCRPAFRCGCFGVTLVLH